MLCVKDVSLRLPESRLLTNVNFTVDKGDIVTLMGPVWLWKIHSVFMDDWCAGRTVFLYRGAMA
ncbi:ABC transporter ATP-binding protein [Escherichia coli]|nr:ABC transporter ATP-binding protein [Escherichia coli]